MLRKCPILAASVLAALSTVTQAVVIEYVPVGDPGNISDAGNPNGTYGGVSTAYLIGKYEVTNSQYVEFLTAKAASDPNSLFAQQMEDSALGGIIQNGAVGNFTYQSKSGYANKPVVYVSFLDAMRFANWLHNGQGNADTETGAYTLASGGLAGRNPGAKTWIPSENEWYKAAYFQPAAMGGESDSYWRYPTRSSSLPNSRNGSTTDPNSANFYNDDGLSNGFNGGYAVTQSPNFDGTNTIAYETNVGAFTLAGSHYGTFDQGGNVKEWNDSIFGSSRGLRGGSWEFTGDDEMASDFTGVFSLPTEFDNNIGFRVAVPEPTVGLALFAGFAFAGLRRKRIK